MRNLHAQSLALIGGLSMMINAGAAWSSGIQASAMIDWSTFSVTGYGLGANPAPGFTWSGQGSNTASSVSDWLSWDSELANNSQAFGVSVSGTGAGTGYGSAQRNGGLTISGSGFVVISANYQLNAAISGISCDGYYCYDQNAANASVSFDLTNTSSNGNHQSHTQPSINLGNSWLSSLTSDHKQGTLSVGVIVNDGDILSFSSAVSAYAHDVGLSFEGVGNGSGDSAWNAYGVNPAAVPLPGAVWLFASALLGQAGIRRQRRSVAV